VDYLAQHVTGLPLGLIIASLSYLVGRASHPVMRSGDDRHGGGIGMAVVLFLMGLGWVLLTHPEATTHIARY